MDCYKFDRYLTRGHFPNDASELPGLMLSSTKGGSLLVLAGVDEVGVGPLAGPVVAAAVILPRFPQIVGLRDSKIVPPEQREALYEEIKRVAISSAISIVDVDVIDTLNIFRATMKAMREAVRKLSLLPDVVVIDGKNKPGTGVREIAVVKGDTKSAAVMAASILAKVTRDEIMKDAHKTYPQYGFYEHKGYACPKHLEALRQHGPCLLHRKSFEPVKSLLQHSSPAISSSIIPQEILTPEHGEGELIHDLN